ncbi:Membrane-associated 30 kDa protein, chloroplastic, partial [Cucurbita argyrosperma subsp. sororia]
MNLFDRFARVVKSYANALVSSFEDPEKILEQTVLEMNDDLTKMRQATAQVLASQKRLENKYKSAQQAADDWYRKAQFALQKGDDDLAREALKRRKSFADNANSLKAQLDQQKNVVENLVSNTRLLESKIQEARSKKDTLKARAQSAKTATKVSEMLGNVNTSSALSAFEKMEEKVMAMESQAEALGQLTADDLEGKFALLEGSSVDDELANLKKELSGSSKTYHRTPCLHSTRHCKPQPSEMNFGKLGAALMILVVVVAFLSNSAAVDAARVVPGDFSSVSNLEMYPTAYEQAKNTVSCWLGRLSSGPSPKGPGH